MDHSGFSFLESPLKMPTGTMSLKMGEKKMGRTPKMKQRPCSSHVRGTVLRECPPN